MPCVEVFQDKETDDLVLCSYVLCAELGGGDTPTGPLVSVPLHEFVERGTDIVTREFELYYTREYGFKSELYDDMTESQQRRFFSQHRKVIVSWPIKNEPVNVYIGPNEDLYGHLEFPFDKATFSDYVLEALSKAGEKSKGTGKDRKR